jgi:hypothetical protein
MRPTENTRRPSPGWSRAIAARIGGVSVRAGHRCEQGQDSGSDRVVRAYGVGIGTGGEDALVLFGQAARCAASRSKSRQPAPTRSRHHHPPRPRTPHHPHQRTPRPTQTPPADRRARLTSKSPQAESPRSPARSTPSSGYGHHSRECGSERLIVQNWRALTLTLAFSVECCRLNESAARPVTGLRCRRRDRRG